LPASSETALRPPREFFTGEEVLPPWTNACL
jgi:hypothetical protein